MQSSDPEKALVADVSAIIDKIRAALSRRGTTSMVALGRSFRVMDDNRNNKLSVAEFRKGMQDFGVGLTKGVRRASARLLWSALVCSGLHGSVVLGWGQAIEIAHLRAVQVVASMRVSH